MTQPTDIRRAAGSPPRAVALCAGYGGLEEAIRAGTGGVPVAFAENDPHAAKVFAAHHPAVPNLGDITAVDWHEVRDLYAPDVIGAGFPCRNISNAGRRDGINGQWSRIWKNVAQAVGVLRPRLVFLENVAAIRSRGRGLDVVAADLAALGYDARWTCLRAGDPEVGAPHPRDRWFAVAHPADADPDHGGRYRWAGYEPQPQGRHEPAHRRHEAAPADDLTLLPTPKASDGPHGGPNQRDAKGNYYLPGAVVHLLPTPRAAAERTSRRAATAQRSAPSLEQAIEIADGRLPRELRAWGEAPRSWQPDHLDQEWGKYEAAVRRWERILGRPAPLPTEPGTRSARRLSPRFVEWMMGLPAGWVTDVPDIPRSEQLKILGNGVVPQQAHYAYGLLLGAHTAVRPEGRAAA